MWKDKDEGERMKDEDRKSNNEVKNDQRKYGMTSQTADVMPVLNRGRA